MFEIVVFLYPIHNFLWFYAGFLYKLLLQSYCQKHSLNCKKKVEDSDSESGGGARKQNLSPEDRRQR
jgi:hypothetical protein